MLQLSELNKKLYSNISSTLLPNQPYCFLKIIFVVSLRISFSFYTKGNMHTHIYAPRYLAFKNLFLPSSSLLHSLSLELLSFLLSALLSLFSPFSLFPSWLTHLYAFLSFLISLPVSTLSLLYN